MLKYFTRILHMRLNTIRVFSKCAERMKNTLKEIFIFNNAGDFKGTEFQKTWMGGNILA